MARGGKWGVGARGLALTALGSALVLNCSSSGSGAALSANCSINSDCDSPLVCAFGRCHDACQASRDCPDGERCILSNNIGTCQLQQESSCTGLDATCAAAGEVCGSDLQCRAECSASSPCAGGDYCLPNGTVDACYAVTDPSDQPTLVVDGVLATDGAVIGDGSAAFADGASGNGGGDTGAPDGTSNGGDAIAESGPQAVNDAGDATMQSGQGGGSDGGDATIDGPQTTMEASIVTCATAQTTFAATGMGDQNPFFTSGVGARTAQQMLVFDSYLGPDPAGDGGGPPIGVVYVQAFDPGTGDSAGAAQPLFTIPNLEGASGQDSVWNNGESAFFLESTAIAPTGEIVLVYAVRFYQDSAPTYDTNLTLYAAFLSPTPADGGAGASDGGLPVQVAKVKLLETETPYGQPHAIWSNETGSFVVSWTYEGSGGDYIAIANFLPDGSGAGGTDPVATDSPNDVIQNSNYEGSSVGVSGSLFAAAYQSDSDTEPYLTLMDDTWTPMGEPIEVAPNVGGIGWTAVAGTSSGFVYLYETAPVSGVFLPLNSDGGITGSYTDASPFQTFTIGGGSTPSEARAVSDDQNGQGGVAIDLFYPAGVSFAYVNASGTTVKGPVQVFAHSRASNDYTSMTNLDGSFVVSLYIAANHQTLVSASGCPSSQ